jgi:hypothetical protein
VIARSRFINKLRELEYTFKDRQKRTELWRKRGGTHRVSIPLNEQLEDEYVSHVLRQCGCADEEIKKFIGSERS